MIIFLQIVFVLSLLGIFFILFKKIPKLLNYSRYPEENIEKDEDNGWDKIKKNTNLSNFFHDIIIPRTEKTLRRLKIVLLRFDNFLAKKADKLREKVKKRNNHENNTNTENTSDKDDFGN